MKYTTRQKFPYPASPQEYGNGATQMEALATSADAALDRISAAWTTLRKPGLIIHHLASNLSVPANSLTDITPPFPTYNVDFIRSPATAAWFPFNMGKPTTAQLGWWLITAHFATQPVGTVNTGSRRYFEIIKTNQANQPSNDTNKFIWEDTESGTGITSAEISFVTRIDTITFGHSIVFFHANVGSNVNILASGTFLEVTQLTGQL